MPLIGLGLGVVGMLLFLRLEPAGSYVSDVLPGIMFASIGMGLVFVPVTLIATSGLPHEDAGLASGLFNTSQQIGGALGLAILSTLATSKTTDELEALGGEPSPTTRRARSSSGFHVAYLAGAILLACAAIVLAVLLRATTSRW